MAVVDRNDDGAGSNAQVAAERVVGIVAAEHPAAAVEVDDDRVRTRVGGTVEAESQRTGRAGQLAVDDLAHLGPGRSLGRHGKGEGSGILDGKGVERRRAELLHQLEQDRGVGLYAADDVVVAARAAGSVEGEAEIAAPHRLVADLAVAIDTADVRQEHARLARHVGAHVPRVRPREERDLGEVVDVLHPSRLGPRRRLDRGQTLLAHVGEAGAHPVHVLLDRHGHVRQHRRAARTGDGEEVGEAAGHQAEVRLRAVDPLAGERHSVAAPDVDGDDGAGHGVEPRGEDDDVELEGARCRVDALFGDGADGVLAQVDQADVGEVERLVVVGVEARALGAVEVVVRAERLRGLGIADDRADLAAQELAHGLVGRGVRADVDESPTEREEFARRVRFLVLGQALRFRHLQRSQQGHFSGNAAAGHPGGFAVGARIGVEGRLLGGGHRSVLRRPGEVRGALEHGERGGLLRDDGNRLDCRGPGADHRHSFSGEVDLVVRPAAGVVRLAREAIGALDVRCLRQREAAGGHDVEPAADLVAGIRAHAPERRGVVPSGGRDPRGEPNVAAEIVLVGDVAEVAEDLGLRRVSLRPLPLALQLRVEAVGVVDALDVAAGARVAVPVPGAADVVGALDHRRREPEAAQAVEQIQAGEACTHHDDVDVRDARRAHGGFVPIRHCSSP